MSERVYIAARYGRRQELRRFAAEVRGLGHEVTSRWLHTDTLNRDLASVYAAEAAARDLKDVGSATTCVAFTEPVGSRQGRGGRHVEFGVAAAFGLRLILVGEPEHVFHMLPSVERCHDAPAALAALAPSPVAARRAA